MKSFELHLNLLVVAFCAFTVPTNCLAQTFDIGWLAFGDLYTVPSHHSEEGDGATGAVLRRAYLTFDAEFNESLFGRLRFETNQDGEFEVYEYDTGVKDLYLGWRVGRHTLVAGLSSTITFDVIEKKWGARSLMRTPLDLQGLPSRDTGLTAKGPLNESGSLTYRAMYAPGIDFGKDSDDNPRIQAAMGWEPGPGWTIDLYTEFQDRSADSDRTTWQAFVARETERIDWGLMYTHQDRGDDPKLELASLFAFGPLKNRLGWIGRIDRLFEPSPKGDGISYLPFDPTAPATLFLAGLQFDATDYFRLTPNIVYTRYDENDNGMRPKSDLYIRLTLFANFE